MAVNTVNNKIYIGQTIKLLCQRKASHYYEAKHGINSTHFHNALAIYHKNTFEWDILEDNISTEELDQTEIFWITYFRYIGAELYNHTNGGGYGHMRGYKQSEEVIRKRSAALRGRKRKPFTEEHRKNMSMAKKGKTRACIRRMPMSTEQRQKLSKLRKGKLLPIETCQKISESLKGNKRRAGILHTEETKRKIGEAQIGRKRSEETKRKMREAWAKRKENEKR